MSKLNNIGAVTLFVEDVATTKGWYERVFDRGVIFEDGESAVLQFGTTMVNLLARTAAHELIAPAAVADRGVGAAAQFTVWVDDVEAMCAALTERGVQFVNGPLDRTWGQRTACFADPDGHLWELAQTIGDAS